MTSTTSALPAVTSFSTENCTSISPLCTIQETTYGYYPSIGSNAFFCVLFGLCCIAQIILGIRYRTWTYLIGLGIGCFGEALGYVGRIILHNNPWSQTGFDIQICCLIISPAFIAAGVYLTLKHFTLAINPSLSLLKPRLYTWIFILCDLISLILQGAGGGIAATGVDNPSAQRTGNNMMIAGVVWQVITLLVFGVLVCEYARRVLKFTRQNGAGLSALHPSAQSLLHRRSFQFFMGAIVMAYFTIFIRCTYRIGEMADGWGSAIMQDEADFIALDGVMIAIAVLCLTIFHPGWAFPEMQSRAYGKTGVTGITSTEKVMDMESSPERTTAATAPSQANPRGGMFGGA